MADHALDYEKSRGGDREERIAPHEIDLIKYRTNRTTLVFFLLTGDSFEGAIRWYDHEAIRIIQSDRTEVTIFRRALAYYRTRVFATAAPRVDFPG